MLNIHWNNESLKKAYGEKLIYWKDICCSYTLKLPLCVPTTYVTENKENHLEIYTYDSYIF